MKKIEQNFSKYADTYDIYCTVQKNIAKELVNKLNLPFIPGNILEIGCGTGNYTMLLREKFPNALIDSIDISLAMLEKAKNKISDYKITFFQQDAQNFNTNQKFDLITSNATFQWFNDLPATLKKITNLFDSQKPNVLFF